MNKMNYYSIKRTYFWILFLTALLSLLPLTKAISCSTNPCQNRAKCLLKRDGSGYCDCASRFVGEYCQYENPCHPGVSQCQNGGTCSFIITESQGVEFKCACPFGFTASLCEIPLDNACDATPCLNHGTCQLTSQSLDQFNCICPAGFEGPKCEHTNHCASGPCNNGARCTSTSSGFMCHCAEGMIGDTCNQDVDECKARNPCIRGTCINLPGTYKCQCPEGFTGKNCESVFVACKPSPCQNGARCVSYDEEKKYHCECAPGFTGRHCDVNINDCSTHVCQNGGVCVDGIQDYSCKCTDNYKGTYCELDIDECQEQGGLCQNGGTCVNTAGGFHCICVNGWEGSYCEVNKDDCESNICYNGGTCHDRVASFYCECAPGKTGLLCHLDDACVSNPCQAGAQCSTNPVDGSYVCSCPKGYSGTDCSIDIDECAQGNPCEHNGKCVNIPGSYKCECASGFTGAWCEGNINECLSSPCRNEATCLDYAGYFSCLCLPGFTGVFCEQNIDDCARLESNPCQNGGVCTDLINAYKCTCPPGFTGIHCENNVNDCRSDSCLHGGTCMDGVNGFNCKCPTGYDGQSCEIYNNHCSSNPCQHGGYCQSVSSGYTCMCEPGYRGVNCEHNIDDCSGEPCRNGGTCIDDVDGFQCYCSLPYSGIMCENILDPCQGHKCRNGAVCKPSLNYRSFDCQCPLGYTGAFCHEDVNECTKFPCKNGGTCKNMHGSYQCICAAGFSGPNCDQNTNECQSMPCMHAGQCVDLIAGFKCVCKEGFTGQKCETNMDDCASNPCENGATCYDHVNRYTCACKPGFSGTNCHVNDKDCYHGLCLNGGTCVDGVNAYKCQCARGYAGKNCQTSVNVDAYNATDVYERELCRRNQCDRKAKNGVCDAECNYFPCTYDGGDCSAGLKPFQNCTVPSYCARVYKDGKCDEICNNEQCLFDGFDCYDTAGPCNPLYKVYCINHFGDDHCDSGCNTAGCGWDGGDCKEESTSPVAQKDVQLSGDVVLILLVEPETFIDQANRFLMSVSKLLHANIKIKQTTDGEPMIYRWTSNGVQSLVPVPKGSTIYNTYSTDYPTRAKRSTKEDQHLLTGTLIILSVDVTKCIEQGHQDCFSNVYNVAKYLGAANAKQDLQELGWPLYSAYGQEPKTDNAGPGNQTVIVVVSLLAVAALLFLVLAVIVRKRKIQAPLWFPDGYQTKTVIESCDKSGCNRNCNTYEPDISFRRRQPDGQELDPEALGQYIDYSSVYDDQPAVKRQRSQGSYSTIDTNSWTKAHYDVANGRLDPMGGPSATGINSIGPDKQTPLHVAAAHGQKNEDVQVKMVMELLNQGAQLNAKTETLEEPALITAARTCRSAIISVMLQHESVDPNDVDKCGRTALHHAVANNSREIVRSLVQHPKIDVNTKDNFEVTPLILTAKLKWDSTEVAEQLISSGASVSEADNEGKTALHWAASENSEQLIRLLLNHGANKDAQDNRDQTPLYLAARNGSKNAVELLLRHGASKDITDQTDRLPRDRAEKNGHHNIVHIFDNAPAASQVPVSMSMLPGSTSTLPNSRKNGAKDKPRRTRSMKEPKEKKKATRKSPLDTHRPLVHGVPVTQSNAGGTSPHVVSPQCTALESPYSTGGLTTPSPGNTLYNGGVPVNLASNDSSLNMAQNSTCMLSPYSGSHAGSSISGRSPQQAMAYKSPPPYPTQSGGTAAYYHQSPQNYGQSPPQQYCQQQEYGMTTSSDNAGYYDYVPQSTPDNMINYQSQTAQNMTAFDQTQEQNGYPQYWTWNDQNTVTQGIY